MAYAAPFIGSQGLVLPSYSDIRSYLLQQFLNIYGQPNYQQADAADYQFISIVSLLANDAMQGLQLVYNSRSPRTAVGSALDAIQAYNGLVRKAPSSSTCQVLLTGVAGTVITNGIVQDVNGLQWSLPSSVTIGSGGTITVTATCQTPGAISANPGDISLIASPTGGWTAVTNTVPAVPGQGIEADSTVRARQALSVARPSLTRLDGTRADVAAVSGVTRYNIVENPTNTTDGFGNPPHSVTAVVEGGADSDVATAIYNNRGIGPLTNGTTSIVVTDPSNGNTTTISFDRPTYVPIYVSLSVHGFTGFTSATQAAIQAALVAYLNALQIGESVSISALNAVAMSATPNLAQPLFSVRALTAGITASPTGTSDIALAFNQVSSTVSGNIVITLV